MKAVMSHLIAAALCLVLTGCVKERKPQVDIQECEARLSDIPIPLNCRPISDSISDVSFAYTSQNAVYELVHYYFSEMERLGWDLMGENRFDETVLVFVKPYKIAIVSLRSNRRFTLVRVDIVHYKNN